MEYSLTMSAEVALIMMLVVGATAICQVEDLQTCTDPVTAEASLPAEVDAQCRAFANLNDCLDSVGCEEFKSQYAYMAEEGMRRCNGNGSGSSATCRSAEMMICIAPFTSGENITAMCSAVATFEGCFAEAGCADMISQYSATINQAKQMCSGTRQCDVNALMACAGRINTSNPDGTPNYLAYCGVSAQAERCVEETGCETFNLSAILEEPNRICRTNITGSSCTYKDIYPCTMYFNRSSLIPHCRRLRELNQCLELKRCTSADFVKLGGDFGQFISDNATICTLPEECDNAALTVCSTPLTDALHSPTNESIQAMCKTIGAIDGCIEEAGCQDIADQYSKSVTDATEMCTRNGRSSPGGECKSTEAYQCTDHLEDATCESFKSFNSCLDENGCAVENFKAWDESLEASYENLRDQCSGTSDTGSALRNALSLTALAVALILLLALAPIY